MVALGIGVAVFALVDGNQGGDGRGRSPSSDVTVLGSVVEADTSLPEARPATPATFEAPTGSTLTTPTSPTVRRRTVRRGAETTTTTGGSSTTSTTVGTTSTSTTAPTTTTTEPTTTTSTTEPTTSPTTP